MAILETSWLPYSPYSQSPKLFLLTQTDPSYRMEQCSGTCARPMCKALHRLSPTPETSFPQEARLSKCAQESTFQILTTGW